MIGDAARTVSGDWSLIVAGTWASAAESGGKTLLGRIGTLFPAPVSPQAVAMVALFSGGVVLGWALASRRVKRQLRRRSLILTDEAQPDMALADGIRHVLAHHRPVPRDRYEAIALILAAARRGQISLWRDAPSNTMRRVSIRQLRAVGPELIERLASPDRIAIRATERFSLRRGEIERRWPHAGAVEITLLPTRR